ncbi:MAG: L,D-transpeptidase family protein [Chitinispirillaceae bacterium]|nr:L,D-transpeptidase family protein [Chitinispirillaceae bacterium]
MQPNRIVTWYERLKSYLSHPDDLYIIIDAAPQQLLLCRRTEIVEPYAASTATLGLGSRKGSNKTPTGIHRIAEIIGAEAPEGRIFRDRRDSGTDWYPGLTEDNLILTRILRLEGLEEGLNKGADVDSYERYIYIHGTNKEEQVGTPLSHGCICLRNRDIVRLSEQVATGTIVAIDAPCLTINGFICSHLHFTGLFGSGMSAIAQYLRWQNITVCGSDRLLPSPDMSTVRKLLAAIGCIVFDQDGTGILPSTDAVCISTAIEDTNPDIAAARARGIPVFHRSDVLAAIIESKESIAIAGTSGKSTVTAMIFEFLDACGKSPSLISGAPLLRLQRQGLVGNAYAGQSRLLVVEVDESDGTLVKYRPATGVILNLSKDHKPIDEGERLFSEFARNCGWLSINADDRGLDRITAHERFGRSASATWKPDTVTLHPDSVTITRYGHSFTLPLAGSHNAENLCAALCVCEHFGCDAEQCATTVRNFEGVARRFTIVRTRRGVTVVDDFAHNPAKIAAAVSAARGLSGRIIAVYQPHGYGPTMFLKEEYLATFKSVFTRRDALFLLPIYYAGGTADKSISSADLIPSTGPSSMTVCAVNSREELLRQLTLIAHDGDCILLMGARDPSLSQLAKHIAALFA